MELKFKKNGVDITESNWEASWQPKSKKQWKDGRSSKEMAKFALSDSFHDLISEVLKSCDIKEQVFVCEPEASSSLGIGFYRGGCRNHDLLMVGENCIIGIEAKVDEPFDKDLGKVLDKNAKDYSKTRADRAKKLRDDYFNIKKDVHKIGYQLFTGTRGTINSAINNSKDKCIFLVIIFDGDIEYDNDHQEKIEKNNEDFKLFCDAIKANCKPFHDDKEIIDCWIKKATVTISTRYSFKL